MPKLLNEREIKYWLTRNTPRASCWVVYTEIEHMTKHLETKVTRIHRPEETDLPTLVTRDQLNYVYTAFMTTKRLITIFELKNGLFYLLDNQKVPVNQPETTDTKTETVKDEESDTEEENVGKQQEIVRKQQEVVGEQQENVGEPQESTGRAEDGEEQNEGHQVEHNNSDQDKKDKIKQVEMKTTSNMIIASSIAELLNHVPGNIRKLINLVKVSKMLLTKEDENRLKRTTGFDFAKCGSEEELLMLFRKYLAEIKTLKNPVKQNNDGKDKQSGPQRDPSTILDFSGNMSIYPAVLEKLTAEETSHIEEIVFFQNIRIGKWLFLSRFKNLKTISFWYMYQLKDDDFNTICKVSPKLEAIDIHESYQISNRVMVPILSILKRIERVCLDNKVLICQKNAYQGVVTEKEWSCIRADSLKYLLINSDNLTQDVIDSYLKACINLKRFIMNGLVLKRLRQNVTEGLGPDTITFQAAEDLRLGFTVKKDIRIANLLKDRYEPAYSSSMLKIIKQQQMGDYSDEEELEGLLQEFEEPQF